MVGPLAGLRVVELGGIGPVPHAGMMLADMGADVVRIIRPGSDPQSLLDDFLLRGRALVGADLKSAADRTAILHLVRTADVVIEGFRPGVAERLGLGPVECSQVNPKVIYGRMTGYGQDGPLANTAGHDINYIGLTGALHTIGGTDPVPPLNLVGDFGGGSMFLVTGVLAALFERHRSGSGQVVDAAIVDGTSVLMQMIWSFFKGGSWFDRRQDNILDGGAPYYRTYRCQDDRHVAVGALEPQFYSHLLAGLGIAATELPDRADHRNWPAIGERFSQTFATKSRDQWAQVFQDLDACVTPVLSLSEVADHPQMAARRSIDPTGDHREAVTAPKFSRHRGGLARAAHFIDLEQAQHQWSTAGPVGEC